MHPIAIKTKVRTRSRLGRSLLALGVGVGLAILAGPASARSFVTLVDDGTIAAPSTKGTSPTGQDLIAERVVTWYKATGQPLPDFLSLWTTFSMDGDYVNTLFDPVANDVTGIGLETQYGGDGTFTSAYPPLRSIMLHNDVTQLAARAKLQLLTSTDGFAQYLFLLELSHNWGPAIAIPADGGTGQDLIGFPFHWSFWMSAGGSPAGGNPWMAGANGSFTVSGWSPVGIRYSMIDLYIMGLATAKDVPSFGVLENPVPPVNLTDPLEGGPYSAASFPWFGATSFAATGTQRTVTMDDVVAANGPRVPDVSTSPKSWTLGVALVVEPTATPTEIAADEAILEPIAASLAPAFNSATGGRGTLVLVTQVADTNDAGATDAGAADTGAPPDAAEPPTPTTPTASPKRGGCNVGQGAGGSSWLLALLPAWVLLRRRRR